MTSYYEIPAVADGALLFHLRSAAGELLLTGGVHCSAADVLRAIEQTRRSAPMPTRYLRKNGADGSFWFIVHDANGQTLAKSEIHSLAWSRNWALERVMQLAADSPLRQPPQRPLEAEASPFRGSR